MWSATLLATADEVIRCTRRTCRQLRSIPIYSESVHFACHQNSPVEIVAYRRVLIRVPFPIVWCRASYKSVQCLCLCWLCLLLTHRQQLNPYFCYSVPVNIHLFIFWKTLSKIKTILTIFGLLNPHLSDVASLPSEIQKSHCQQYYSHILPVIYVSSEENK